MSGFLYRLGHGAAAHPWRTICAWVAIAVATVGLTMTFGGETRDDYNVPDAPAQAGVEQLRTHLPEAGFASAQVVVHDRAGAPVDPAALEALAGRLADMPHVLAVQPPQLSADGDTALVAVGYDVPVTDPDLMGNLEPLEEAVAGTRDLGLQVELGGEVPQNAAAPMKGYGELVGIIAALVILVLTLGSVVGAGLPLAVALTGLGVGSGGIALLAGVMDVSTSAPTVATMVGLGVGIDYALLLVTRHTEFLRAGHDVADAAGRAVATAGRSVVFAAGTVLVSLLGLRLSGLQVYASFCFATAIAVVAVLAAALTLVPALCRLGGRRLLPRKVRRGAAETLADAPRPAAGLTARWAARVGRRPLPWAIGAALVMVTLAAARGGHAHLAAGPQHPVQRPDHASRLRPGQRRVRARRQRPAHRRRRPRRGPTRPRSRRSCASWSPAPTSSACGRAVVSPDGAIATFDAVPAYGPTDERTPGLVDAVRAEAPAGVEVTGMTAMFADIADLLAHRVWLVIGFVVGVSVLLLTMVFRSVVVPLKAAVMNLLSIGAAYGVMTARVPVGLGHPGCSGSTTPCRCPAGCRS